MNARIRAPCDAALPIRAADSARGAEESVALAGKKSKKGGAAPETPQKPAKKRAPATPKPKAPADPCSICLAPIKVRDVTVLSCSHAFHASCLATLERHGKGVGTTRRSVVVTCPLCRKRARGSDRRESGARR